MMSREESAATKSLPILSAIAGAFITVSWVLLLLCVGCSTGPDERLNPLDSDNPITGDDPFHVSLNMVEVQTDSGLVERIQVGWLDIDHGRLSAYSVRRSGRGTTFEFSTLGTTQPGDTTFLDSSCISPTPYYYKVLAVFNGGADTVASSIVSTAEALPEW